MKIMFVDETSKTKDNKCFLCLCGVIVDASNVAKLESELQKFKKENDFINFKDFRNPDNMEVKLKLTQEINKILQKNEVNIISSVILEDSLKTIKLNNRNNFEALQRFHDLYFILERFSFHLNRRSKTGMIIFDSLDKKIEKNMGKLFFEEISKSNKFRNIFSSLLFSKDEYINILQIADLIGVSLNSALYKSMKKYKRIKVDELPQFNPYLDIYWNLFEINKNTNSVGGWGLKVWF